MMPERIGFVGVGRMGANMARRLNEVGYKVTAVSDVRRNAAEALAKELCAEDAHPGREAREEGGDQC